MLRTLTTLLATVLLAAPARAATIVVPPGPGTPVQDAIDAASPGDTIRLTLGTYPERLLITKRIKLRGVRSTSVEPGGTTAVGDVGCGLGPTIVVTGEGAQIRGVLVLADGDGGVYVSGDRIKLTDVFVTPRCEVFSGPQIDVDGGTRVRLSKVWVTGYPLKTVPAGIRIGDIPPQGRVRVSNAIAGHSAIGILLENSAIQSVRVSSSDVNFNVRGIVLRNTSQAVVSHNELVDNDTSGIEIEAGSSANAIVRNRISGSASDVVDAGAANCWRNNTFTTGSVPACP